MDAKYKKIRSSQISQQATAWANANPGVKGEWQARRSGFVNGAKWHDDIYPHKLTEEKIQAAKEEYLKDKASKTKEARGIGFEAGVEWARTSPPRMKQLDLFENYDE